MNNITREGKNLIYKDIHYHPGNRPGEWYRFKGGSSEFHEVESLEVRAALAEFIKIEENI